MRSILNIIFYMSVSFFFFSCNGKKEMSMEAIAQADLEAQEQRKQQKMRLVQLMANELPLYRTLPVEGLAQTDVLLSQGSSLYVLDERIFIDDRKKEYLYVEVVDSGKKGYILQEYLIDASYTMGLTSRYTSHYFQPDYRAGASSTIFLPAYTAIFSDDLKSDSPFIAYYGVDLYGYPLKGYLERDAVLFSPNVINAYELYRKALTSSTINEQMEWVNQLKREYNGTPFAKLADDLMNIRNLSEYGSLLTLFDQGYRASRSEHLQKQVIPLYSQPSEQASILGYITDDRVVELTAGYGMNSDLSDLLSPFAWYLIDLRGWVKAEHVELKEHIREDNELATFLLEEEQPLEEVLDNE